MSSPVAYASSGKRISLLNPLDDDLDDFDDDLVSSSSCPAPKKPPKRYNCKKCLKTFSTSGHLTRHNRTHTGVKEHACPFPNCEKECGRLDNLIQHFRVHLPKADRGRGNTYTRSCMEQLRADLLAQASGYSDRPYPPMSFEEWGPEVSLSLQPSSSIPPLTGLKHYVVLRSPRVQSLAVRSDASSYDERPIASSYDERPVDVDRSAARSPTSTVSSSGFSSSPVSPVSSPMVASVAFTHQMERLRMEDDRHRHQYHTEVSDARPNKCVGSGDYVYPGRDTPVDVRSSRVKPVYGFEESFVRGGAE